MLTWLETEAIIGKDAGSNSTPDDELASEDGEVTTTSQVQSARMAFSEGWQQPASAFPTGAKRPADDNDRRSTEKGSGRGG